MRGGYPTADAPPRRGGLRNPGQRILIRPARDFARTGGWPLRGGQERGPPSRMVSPERAISSVAAPLGGPGRGRGIWVRCPELRPLGPAATPSTPPHRQRFAGRDGPAAKILARG